MTGENWIALITAIAWPGTVLLILVVFHRHLASILSALKQRIDAGSEVKTPWISIGAVPMILESPKKDEPVTGDHMALIHSSWRYRKKDKEFKRPMYCYHAVIQAEDAVLDRIEYVTYQLHPSYPNPIQKVTTRETRFKLKELAWGEAMLKADVKVKGQEEPIKLSRYINLTDRGPRI
jgi:hypothetical protein